MSPRFQASATGEEGLVCLAAGAAKLGQVHDLRELRAAHGIRTRGMKASELIDVAASMNLGARLVRFDPEAVRRVAMPAVLQWEAGRFVLLDRALRGGAARIFDPGSGWRKTSAGEIAERAGPVAIELTLAGPVLPRRQRARIGVWSLFHWNRAIGTSISQALIVSLFLQFYTLVSPMYLRLVLDDFVVAGTRDELSIAAVAFGLLAVFNAGAGLLRGIVLQNLNNQLSWDMTTRIFRHMLRLPLQWFQSRRLADILSRLQGVDQVRLALTALLGALFDAMLAAITLVALILVSPAVLAVAVVGLALLSGLRLAAVPVGIELGNKAVVAAAAEQGKRIETLRAIQSIKTMSAEPRQESEWLNRLADMLASSRRSAIFGISFGSAQGLITALMYIAAILVGARAVLDGRMSIGMLTAALAYLSQFSQSISNLFQQFITWRTLDVQLERLSDVVLEPVERNIDRPATPSHRSSAKAVGLEAQGLSFRYNGDEPWLFKELHLKVEAGEHVAIVGPSGCGKSTLLKLLTGLYRPAEGVIRIDGTPTDILGPRGVRQMLGAVMQDDELMAGSIGDNVSFFDEEPDIDHLWVCLEGAGLSGDVQGFPLGLDTLVGDMGTALSGGQKQRLLIARALYRRPRLLILDEATSHLDVPAEKRIAEMLRRLDVTRIVVAHRPDTISAADRVLRLGPSGLAVERPLGAAT